VGIGVVEKQPASFTFSHKFAVPETDPPIKNRGKTLV